MGERERGNEKTIVSVNERERRWREAEGTYLVLSRD